VGSAESCLRHHTRLRAGTGADVATPVNALLTAATLIKALEAPLLLLLLLLLLL
jgi:hypothetical protein